MASIITFEFSAPVSTIGWAMLFDEKMNQYPAQITITAYASDGSTVATGTKMITQARQNISMTAANYTKLTIRFDKTLLPKTRARLRQIDFGLGDVQERIRLARGADAGFLAGKHVIRGRSDRGGVFGARTQGRKGANQRAHRLVLLDGGVGLLVALWQYVAQVGGRFAQHGLGRLPVDAGIGHRAAVLEL